MFLRKTQNLKMSVLFQSLRMLPKSDYPKIGLISVTQVMLSFLDLAGVALIGLIGALSITGIKSGSPGSRTETVLKFLHMENLELQVQVAILGISAAVFLLSRTLFSVYLSRKILRFLSLRGAAISSELLSKLMTQPLLGIRAESSQNTLFALTSGVQSITIGIIANLANLLSDVSLLLVMGIGLFAVDYVTAIATFVYFGIISYIVYKVSTGRAHKLGELNTELGIESSEKILEVIAVYKEISVRNRREYYVRKISEIRYQLASVLAEIQFMPNISKYVMESSMVIGALLISMIQFLLQDATHAIATLSIFLAAGTRIAPAVMRVQQGSLQLRTSAGTSKLTLELVERLKNSSRSIIVDDTFDMNHTDFIPELKISDLCLRYPGSSDFALINLDFEVRTGTSLAIVGPSGAGKTSLVDILLGIMQPTSGSIEVSGAEPTRALSKWPGAMAYVPQEIVLLNGTIRENLAVGYPSGVIPDQTCWEALESAQLGEFVGSLPDGLDAYVGEFGSNLSGGQRQRLGIARALLTKPKLLVLDEATSALDAKTEQDVSGAIQKLQGQVTLITVAHRLSTVKQADKVLYLENGSILAQGNFEEVRLRVPNFDEQAKLMGL